MANGNIYDAFKQRSEYLTTEVYNRASFNSIMLNVTPKGEYGRGLGLSQTLFEVGNAYPTTDERTWDSYTLANGSNTGACAYNFTDYTVGFDELTYSPKHMQLRGPRLCKDDLYFSHLSPQFLEGYVSELAKLAELELSNHIYTEYAALVPKAVATAAVPITAAGAPFSALPEATSDLTQEMLDKIAVHLIHSRATQPDSSGFVSLNQGGPLFSLYIGMEASQGISLVNANFRQDLRDGNSSELMRRIGANTAIKNFRHIINPLPPRYTFSGGTYTRVDTFVNVNGTKGVYQDINPAYLDPASAPYEAAVVLSPNVMQWDWVRPDNVVAGQRWEPSSYMGNWDFITGAEAAATDGSGYDPKHKFGQHIAEIAGAAKPGSNRKAGLVILFKRCHLTSVTTATCS